ncbi:MAG TPA: DUF1028 domain-containing protein [Ktedonobacterales bacterium]|jgi:uncharacterized Ntn-hydrolase superfamily protein
MPSLPQHAFSLSPHVPARSERFVSTFSIVACDPATGDLGVAVESKFLAVGAVVPWARAGVGAIATQSWANTTYGPDGLDLLAQGKSPDEVMAALTGADEHRALRQAGIVDAKGRAATYTGSECFAWCGGITGPNYTCQGNILVSEATVQAMARAFEATTGGLWDRLVAALAAGQAAGGDSRGQQSAALLVVREKGGYAGFNDRFIDLRVDEHPRPIEELARILEMHKLYLFKTDPNDILPIDEAIASELQKLLTKSGDYTGAITGVYDETTRAALNTYSMRENVEDRWVEGPKIDRVVLNFIRQQVGQA